ncbi:hypothetical protein [Halalkalibacter oceani]|uniref:hypothetical protein n=1 Tax=Halalkalibacter oceani TaxID=1653776 RepID=UPI0033936FF8
MNNDLYEIVFTCPFADYWWTVETGLTLEEAEKKVETMNKYNLIHKENGCCRHYLQPSGL